LYKFIGKANPELNDQETRDIVIHFLEEDMDVCTDTIFTVPSCFKVANEEDVDWETISNIWTGEDDISNSTDSEFRKIMHMARKIYAFITGNTFMNDRKSWTSPNIVQIPPYVSSIQDERMLLELVPDYVVDYHETFKIFRCSRHSINVSLKLKKGYSYLIRIRKWKSYEVDNVRWISERELKGVVCGKIDGQKLVCDQNLCSAVEIDLSMHIVSFKEEYEIPVEIIG
jgi:hypothetical protein